jgi:hypothetical protein
MPDNLLRKVADERRDIASPATVEILNERTAIDANTTTVGATAETRRPATRDPYPSRE